MNSIPQTPVNETPVRNGAPLAGIPTALQSLPHWVVRKAKVPHQPRNPRYGASSTNPDHWTDLDTAIKTVRRGDADGIGFVFALSLQMVFIDLDDCFDDQGNLKPYAAEIVAMLPTHWHISMSGRGLHGVCYGSIPAALKNSGAGVEMYSSERYMAWPTDVRLFGGTQEITDCSEAVAALYARYAKPEPTTQVSAPVEVSHDVQGILERMERNPKYAALLRGDASDYAGWSEARMALAYAARFWRLGESDIADVILRSNLFKPEDHERERGRRAANDAAKACKTYTGPFYDPDYRKHQRISISLDDVPQQDAPDTPDDVEALKAELARARAANAKYQETLDAIAQVVGVDTVDPQMKIVFLGTMFMGMEHKAKRRPATDQGDIHSPASWIGQKCGMSTQAVNRQLRRLQSAEIIDRDVRKETTTIADTWVDDDGVIETTTREVRGNKNYIAYPDNIIDMVPRLAAYQKPEDAPKRGGVRVPACDKHPDAGIVRRSVHYCEACYADAQRAGLPLPAPLHMSEPVRIDRAEIEGDDVSGIKHECDNPTVVIGGIKLESETVNTQSPIKLESDSRETIGSYCDWKQGGEECGNPTEAWEHEGYGSQTKCHKHAEQARKSGSPPQRVIIEKGIYRGEVAS